MYMPREDRLRVLQALCVAALAHKGQKRKSGEPYIVHPVAVAELLASLRLKADVVMAGLLHDAVEDNQEIQFEDLEELFGRDVRKIVEGETKASKRTAVMRSDDAWSALYHPAWRFVFGARADGKERGVASAEDASMAKAREQATNLRDMFLAMADDWRVIIVKLADRLHNMRTLDFMPAKKRARISSETLAVFVPLAHRLGVWEFKTELEDLCFRHLFPEEFDRIDKVLASRRPQHRLTLEMATRDLKDLLEQDSTMQEAGVKLCITAREKGMYSLWRKLQRNPKYRNNLDNVSDIIALRVVLDIDRQPGETNEDYDLRGKSLCYRAVALATRWDLGDEGLASRSRVALASRIKDYIQLPKPNGYRSIHLILTGAPVPLELQIRTRQMHNVAEYGMASHFAYKEGGPWRDSSRVRGRGVAWLASLREKDRDTGADPTKFVEEVLREELGNRCFVFLRNGRILNLSRGCTALDAAFRIGAEVGMTMDYPEVNGAKVEPSRMLQNGDCINIVTSPGSTPRWEWLRHAFLSSTRAELIAHFRSLQKEESRRQTLIDVAAVLATVVSGMVGATSALRALRDSDLARVASRAGLPLD